MKKVLIVLFVLLSLNIFSDENNVKKISVTGNAERLIMPDMATINFKIEEYDKNLSTASNKVKQKLQNFRKDLQNENVSLPEIETVLLTDRKVKESDKNNTKKIKSYVAKMNVYVKNIDFNKVGDILEINSGKDFQSVTKNEKNDVYEIKLQENDKTINGVLQKLFSKIDILKRKLKSIDTQNNISFGEYKIDEKNESDNKVEVYYVTQDLKVTTKNLKDLNMIISLADKNGLNIENSIKFDLSNRNEIESQMYSEAYNQARQKAESILKSSNLQVGDVIVVSEDTNFQQKMIDRIDSQWQVETKENNYYSVGNAVLYYDEQAAISDSVSRKVDYTPKPLKIEQNISVMYEMK